MAATPSERSPWLPTLGVWIAIAAIFLPQMLALNHSRPQPEPWWVPALRSFILFLLWAPATLLVIAAVRRWPIVSPRMASLWRHAALAFAIITAHLLIMTAVIWLSADGTLGVDHALRSSLLGLGATNVLMMIGVYAVAIALQTMAEQRAAERARVAARIAALQAQLQPHFLFNTLNALAELVHADATAAEHALLRLASLLRRSIDGASASKASVAEELAMLDDYLAIQSLLLGDRLIIERRVSPECLACLLPRLTLQPLVENAIVHGVARRAEPSRLVLSVARQLSDVVIQICNPLAAETATQGFGMALGNVRERLAAIYRGQARLTTTKSAGEFMLELRVPYE